MLNKRSTRALKQAIIVRNEQCYVAETDITDTTKKTRIICMVVSTGLHGFKHDAFSLVIYKAVSD